jgi:DNA-binding PadR family transcriptional regulator
VTFVFADRSPFSPKEPLMDQGNATGVRASATPEPGTPPLQGDSAFAAAAQDAPDRAVLLQEAYLLEQLASHHGTGGMAAALNRRISKPAQRDLRLTAKVANAVRASLAERGYLAANRQGRTVRYAITDSGRSYLAGLERPMLSGRGKPAPSIDDSTIPDEIREGQNAYLLLQLLNAEGETLTRGEANKRIPRPLQTRLSLTPASANARRAKLAERGYLRIASSGRNEVYSLTRDGVEYLAAGAQHLAHADFVVKGKTLNALVAAARESPFQAGQASAPASTASAPPDQATLELAVLAEFEELHRECHGRSGLVPIHEVRQRIAQRFGPAAGRHDVLDEVILGLWRQKRLGLEGISDLSLATPAQLNDAIPGVSGPLFYLEAPREQPVTP